MSNAWPAMLPRVACVEIKVAEKLYRRTQRAFLFNLLVFFRASKCIYLCIFSCYDVKDVHYSFSENIHLHKIYKWQVRREEGAVPPMIKKLLFAERSNLQ